VTIDDDGTESTPGVLVTQTQMDAMPESVLGQVKSMVQDAIANQMAALDDRFDQAEVESKTQAQQIVAATASEIGQQISTLQDDLDGAVADLGELAGLQSKATACAAAVVEQIGGAIAECPQYDTTGVKSCSALEDVEYGQLHGTGREVGATRSVSCDEGMQFSLALLFL
jgi:hypothetical protein